MTTRIVALALIGVLGLASAPAVVEAQAANSVRRVGVLRPAPDGPEFRQVFEPFRQALRERGFLEEKNLTIELRVRPGTADQMRTRARELVQLNVDAILAVSPTAVSAAMQATTSIPIVAIDLESDPQASGFAASLARPGGNVTGLFLDVPELGGKWIELLKEMVPYLARIAVLDDRATGLYYRTQVEAAARALKVQTLRLEVRTPEDFAETFRSAATARSGALLVLPSPVVNSARRQIAELAAKHRMPAIMPFAGFVEDGGLLAYGPDTLALYEQAGGIVAKVLRGTRPAEIPIERPTRFELSVNRKTAQTLNLTLPSSLLLRANKIVE